MRIALLLLCSLSAFAATDLARIDAQRVQFDALVTDESGQPVPNLTAADFEILQDGLPREIVRAEWIDAKRTFVLIVDDLGITPRTLNQGREAAAKFIDSRMQPGDRMAIVRASEGNGESTAFTEDKQRLLAVLARLAPHPAAARESEGFERFNTGTLGILHYVLRGLREIDGRKTVLLLSDRLRSFRPQASDAAADTYLRVLGDQALRSGAILEANLEALNTPAGYYLLAYRSDRQILDREFHPLEVRLKNPAWKIRTRTGFYGREIPPQRLPLFSATARGELSDALFLPFTAHDVPLRITALPMTSEKNEPFLRILVALETKESAADMLLLSLGLNGKTIKQTGQRMTINSPGRVLFHADQPLPHEGPVHVRASVLDAGGRRGSAHYYTEMPAYREEKLSLSGIYLGQADAPLANPALRTFPPGAELPFAFSIFHSRRPAQLEASFRISGPKGVLLDQPFANLSIAEKPDGHTITRAGAFKLSADAAPGEYTLEATVRDPSAKSGENQASQSIRFVIAPPASAPR